MRLHECMHSGCAHRCRARAVVWPELEISGIYWDDVFSTIYATNLVLTTIYYIKGVSALIRLSDSQYYTHPEDLRRRRHRQNHASSVQLAPI